jgi:hypothetical protein
MKPFSRRTHSRSAYVTGFLLLILLHYAHSEELAGVEAWQNNILFNPNESTLERERSGTVMIYDGISHQEIERAMQEQFNRVEAMMFVNIVHTNKDGEVLRDPVTKPGLDFDDGCD